METNKNLAVEANEKQESKELIKYYEQKNTPFTIVEKFSEEDEDKAEYYVTCHGRVMTYPFDSYKEAANAVKYHSWDLITALIFLITDVQKTAKKEDKE